MNFKEFYTHSITYHLKQRKRLDTHILNFVLHTYKDGKLKISPIISRDSSPMDHAQDAINSLQPEMYVICAESWMHKPKDWKKFQKEYKYGNVSSQENKMETMVFMAKTMDGKEEHQEIHRIIRKDKKIIDYEKLDRPKMTTTKLT